MELKGLEPHLNWKSWDENVSTTVFVGLGQLSSVKDTDY